MVTQFSRRPRVRATCVATIGLFVCLAAAVPVEADSASGPGAAAQDDQWLHMRSLLRHRRRAGARVDRSRLQVPLGPPPRRVISHDQVVAGACALFLNRGTVDMDQLALSLAISRATLYRIVHSRDELMSDVLWRLGDQVLTQVRQARVSTGVEGVLEVARGFTRRVGASWAFRRFLATEPETATGILFTATGGVHRRAVEAMTCVLADATPAGTARPWLRGDLDKLSYLLVRIFESMYCAELLHGDTPDADLVEHAARALLEQAARSPQRIADAA